MKKFALACSAITLALVMGSTQANAETVTTTTETHITSKEVPGATPINFSVFDLNNDGIYSMNEVGERLFRSFDQDGNELIDNIEWDKKTVITIMPMEKETFQSIDYDNDGIADKTTYTHQTFFEASGLNRFDKNMNGLSAQEFIGENFYKLDDDNNNLIDIKEWRSAYIHSLPVPQHNKPSNYNK